MNEEGDVPREGGLFREIRYLGPLSWHLSLNGKPLPLVRLSTHLSRDGDVYSIGYGHEASHEGQRDAHSLVVQKTVQWETRDRLVSTFCVTNYDQHPCTIEVDVTAIDPDFKDIMEIRGIPREDGTQGTLLVQRHEKGALWRYEGRDGIIRETQLSVQPSGSHYENTWSWSVSLAPGETKEFVVQVAISAEGISLPLYGQAAHESSQPLSLSSSHLNSLFAGIITSDWRVNQLLDQGRRDSLSLLFEAELPTGDTTLFPAAGVPWFFTPFARDALIWGLQILPLFPEMVRNILSLLASYQGGFPGLETYQKRASGVQLLGLQPGKIPHELRTGEMARLGLHPYGVNYQSLDATPLFCWLMAQYVQRTGDTAFLHEYWQHFEAAVQWIISYGDYDGDGFLEHERGKDGLAIQSWKDSPKSMCHRDGSFAMGSLAPIEVQGAAFAALREGSKLAFMLGKVDQAKAWQARALELQSAFIEAFWDEDAQYWALALDGNGGSTGRKRPCAVASSNPGQALLTGIIPSEKVEQTARRLMQPDLFSGWGIRTLGAGERCYHPLSYHNGSVWPHDTGLIAAGLAHNDRKADAARLFSGLVDAAEYHDWRLPEVLGGFARISRSGPMLYPTACRPQLWAAGVPFLLLTSLLGLDINGLHETVTIRRPHLPDELDWVELRGLRLGDYAPFTLRFERTGSSTNVCMQGTEKQPEMIVEHD
jgi:glycogen debranching enzyme